MDAGFFILRPRPPLEAAAAAHHHHIRTPISSSLLGFHIQGEGEAPRRRRRRRRPSPPRRALDGSPPHRALPRPPQLRAPPRLAHAQQGRAWVPRQRALGWRPAVPLQGAVGGQAVVDPGAPGQAAGGGAARPRPEPPLPLRLEPDPASPAVALQSHHLSKPPPPFPTTICLPWRPGSSGSPSRWTASTVAERVIWPAGSISLFSIFYLSLWFSQLVSLCRHRSASWPGVPHRRRRECRADSQGRVPHGGLPPLQTWEENWDAAGGNIFVDPTKVHSGQRQAQRVGARRLVMCSVSRSTEHRQVMIGVHPNPRVDSWDTAGVMLLL